MHALDVSCLESLEIERLVSEHCHELRELSMGGHMHSLLPVLGDQLLKLEIRLYGAADKIDSIRTHCHSLQTVNLLTYPDVKGALARLLASYGNQLKEASLDNFDLESVEIVASACPNVKAGIFVNDPLVLVELGSRAHVVQLLVRGNNPADVHNGLRCFIYSCRALEKLMEMF